MKPDSPGPDIRGHFLAWQCRLRQEAMRRQEGRPSLGMRPRATHSNGREISSAITVLILEKNPEATTAMFRHIVRKTHDSYQCYQEGLRILSSAYYQYPENFSDVLTALFSADSAIASTLVEKEGCDLHFRQGNQSYRIPCSVGELRSDTSAFQATLFHNHLFNLSLPAQVRVLAFHPHWIRASAVPAV